MLAQQKLEKETKEKNRLQRIEDEKAARKEERETKEKEAKEEEAKEEDAKEREEKEEQERLEEEKQLAEEMAAQAAEEQSKEDAARAEKRTMDEREREMSDGDDDDENEGRRSRARTSGTPTRDKGNSTLNPNAGVFTPPREGDGIDVEEADMGIDIESPPKTHRTSQPDMTNATPANATAPKPTQEQFDEHARGQKEKTTSVKGTGGKASAGSKSKSKGPKLKSGNKGGGVKWSDGKPGKNGNKAGGSEKGSAGKSGGTNKSDVDWTDSNGKKRKTNLGSKSRQEQEEKAAPPDFNFSAFVEMFIYLPPGMKSSEVVEYWQERVGELLDLIHEMDNGSFCIILPGIDDVNKRIYSASQFPKHFMTWQRYVKVENPAAMGWGTSAEKGRLSVCSVRMGFEDEPKQFLAAAGVDIRRVEGLRMEYSDVQAWDVRKDLMMMYNPTAIPEGVMAADVSEFLEKSEELFMIRKPSMFPAAIHAQPFPRMECALDWSKGVWDPDKPSGRSDEDMSHRKVHTFSYPGEHAERIQRVVREVRRRGMETRLFGEHAFFQYKLPSKADPETKRRFLNKLRNHGAIQKSTGSMILTGLVRPDWKVKVELHDDANGPRASPGEYSVRDLASKMMVGHQRLWQGIFGNHSGGYTGFFPGTDQAANDLAIEIAGDLAGYLKCYLTRQGWKMVTIKQLIIKSFDEMAADDAQLAKWDSSRGKLISGASVKQAQHNAVLDHSYIDRSLGLASWEIAREAKEAEASNQMGTEMSELRPGSMGAFNYSDDRSEKTAISGKTAKTFQFDAESKFTAGSDESMEWSDDDDDGEGGADGMAGVRFEMPDGGIGGQARGSGGGAPSVHSVEEDSSMESSTLPEPSNLNTKFGDKMDTGDDAEEDSGGVDRRNDGAGNAAAANPNNYDISAAKKAALGQALATIESLREQIRIIEAASAEMNNNSGAEVNAEDAATNVPTDIDPTSSSRRSPQDGADHENTPDNGAETQEASADNDPSLAG